MIVLWILGFALLSIVYLQIGFFAARRLDIDFDHNGGWFVVFLVFWPPAVGVLFALVAVGAVVDVGGFLVKWPTLKFEAWRERRKIEAPPPVTAVDDVSATSPAAEIDQINDRIAKLVARRMEIECRPDAARH